MSPAIELAQLSHRFGDLEVLHRIDLAIHGPGVFGFLGVNGAGKSTTMRILNGFLEASDGQARVLGEPVGPRTLALRRRIGYLPQVPAFHGWMTAREVLSLTAALYGMDRDRARTRSETLLERLDLGEAAHRRTAGYSGGMRQRLGLAQALLPEPELLLLDEPVSALDPVGRMETLDLIGELGEAVTVFMSTHILDDVERICDHVTILHRGRIVADEPTAGLLARYAHPVFHLAVGGDATPLSGVLGAHPLVSRLDVPEDPPPEPGTTRLRIHTGRPEALRVEIPALLARFELPLFHFAVESADLESVFMRLVGHEGREHGKPRQEAGNPETGRDA